MIQLIYQGTHILIFKETNDVYYLINSKNCNERVSVYDLNIDKPSNENINTTIKIIRIEDSEYIQYKLIVKNGIEFIVKTLDGLCDTIIKNFSYEIEKFYH